MRLSEFQKAYGKEWVEILKSGAFQAATAFVTERKIENLSVLTDSDIDSHSKQILGDLRGHFALLSELESLHTKEDKEFKFEEEGYISPEIAAEVEALINKRKQEQKRR